MKLIKVGLLRHIEAFSTKRVANITRKMLESGIWEKPICVERNHFLVLDGQHRLMAAQEPPMMISGSADRRSSRARSHGGPGDASRAA